MRRAVAAPRVRGIGRRVIRHHGLHGDPLGAEPRQRPLQEGQGVAAPVGGPHLGVGQPGVVVDGDMHVLPARAGTAPDTVLANALAHVPAAGQLLGVQVEQLAGLGARVAHDGRPWSPRPARVAQPPQHFPHGLGGAPQQRPQRHGPGAAALACRQDLRLGVRAQAPGCRVGMDGRSRRSRQPPSRKRAHQR